MSVALNAMLLLAAAVAGVFAADASHWSYSGHGDPAHWAEQYPTCAGSKQSPIDLDPSAAVASNYDPIFMANYDTMDKSMKITNNGHTAFLSLPKDYPQYRVPYIKDGGLQSNFSFAQLHFHWGSISDRGSEHTLISKKFPAELHFVHFNNKYGTFANATAHPDGLAVLGVFLQVSSEDNAAVQPIVQVLDKIVHEATDTTLDSNLNLKDLLPSSTATFYRYSGSLTTPGCQEIVVWTVFEKPITISERQLNAFRNLTSEDGRLVNNYRPVQPLHGRTVSLRSSTSKLAPNLATLDVMAAIFFAAYLL